MFSQDFALAWNPVPSSTWCHVGFGSALCVRRPGDPALLFLSVFPPDGCVHSGWILPPQQPSPGFIVFHVPNMHRKEGAIPGIHQCHQNLSCLCKSQFSSFDVINISDIAFCVPFWW